MVLDLVPTIVSTMNTVGLELTTDSLAGDDIVTNLLNIPWKSRGIVPLSLSLLTDLDLNSEQVYKKNYLICLNKKVSNFVF